MFVIRQKNENIYSQFKIFEFPKDKSKASNHRIIFRYIKIVNPYFISYLSYSILNLERMLIDNYNGIKVVNKNNKRGEIRFKSYQDAKKVVEFFESILIAERLNGK